MVRLFTGVTRPKNPILGTAFAGEVKAIGKDVTRFKPGERVFGASNTKFGTYAEFLTLPEDGILAPMPAGLSYGEAVGISEGFLTALPFLRDKGKIRSGQQVLINGASGSVGSAAVQIARHFGAEVTGVCSTANVDLVKALGANHVIDYTKEDFTAGGKTYDIIFDAVGKSSFSRCEKALKPNGVYLVTAMSPVVLWQVLRTSMGGGKKARNAATGLRKPAEQTRDLLFLNELVASGELVAAIDRTYPLEQMAEAHRYVETGHKKGSVVISVNGEPV
jgi:NADPH:quinone reductase-like Zn-dependent oxidoreductase